MFSFSFMNTLNFHIYFYYFSQAVFLMRLSEKKPSFILVLYIHTQIFTMVSFFFSRFFSALFTHFTTFLHQFAFPRSLSVALRSLSRSCTRSVFCFASQEFLYTRSRLAAAQLWRLFVHLPLPLRLSRSPSLLLSVSLLPPKIVSALSIFPV